MNFSNVYSQGLRFSSLIFNKFSNGEEETIKDVLNILKSEFE